MSYCGLAKLPEEDKALLLQAQLANILRKPARRDVNTLREWLNTLEFGNMFLLADVEDVWDDERGFEDYTSFMHSENEVDGVTAHLSMFLLRLQRAFFGKKYGKDHIFSLRDSVKRNITFGFLTAIASVFPVLPVVILFFVHQLLIRLVLIMVFTAIFALVLVFGMQLGSDKVLAITTAQVQHSRTWSICLLIQPSFAAVQVVFVGSTN